MKKILLLLAIICIASNLYAQKRSTLSTARLVNDRVIDVAVMRAEMQKRYAMPAGARKTTATLSRWFSYSDAIDTKALYEQTVGVDVATALTNITIWNDTNGTALNTSGFAHNTTVSQADIFDPCAPLLNNSMFFAGQMGVDTLDAYTCDSVDIFGLYSFNKTKTTVVDTLRILFTKGDLGFPATTNVWADTTSGGHYGPIYFSGISYDSTANKGTGSQVADLHYQDVILDNSGLTPAWGDTMANGIWTRRIAVNGSAGINAAAKDKLGWTLTFISGDPETKGAGKLASPTPGDTLVTSSFAGQNEYNVWRPLVRYYTMPTTSPVPSWAPFYTNDRNAGLWKDIPNYYNGWVNIYVPMWSWSEKGGVGATVKQFPAVSWHVTCTTCKLLKSGSTAFTENSEQNNIVNVYPDPANNEVNITFSLATAADVKVTLTNLLGQVVATKAVDNTAEGIATFNTASLSPGVYVYTLRANGETATGRVVVAH
ncbi:MAG: hypothetical protein JWQ38_3175 [Flavipsychrobacter sp.]|nr:hypothetical protein [Flavipsychrobacter sp.]